MKAAQITEYGGPEVLRIVETDKPEIAPDQVLVQVHAAGINPFDIKVRDGAVKQMVELQFPATLGGDVAGTVDAVGSDVQQFSVGQSVFGQAGALSGHGSFAEFTPVRASQLAVIPKSTDYIQAGSLPLAAASAYQSLVDIMHLQNGQKILIHGGSGGIGSISIQIAKHIGATVVTTVSESSIDFVTKLGADQVIDYTKVDFESMVNDCDAVFDMVGGELNNKSYQVLKRGGIFVSMVAPESTEQVQKTGVTYVRMQSKVTTERLSAIAKLIDDGYIHPVVDNVFPLSQTAEAMEYAKSAHLKGKVVIQILGD